LLVAVSVQLVTVLPMVFLGTLAADIRDELRFDAAALGAGYAVCYLVGALLSVPLGHLSQLIGPGNSARVSCVLAICSLFGIAALSHSWVGLLPFFVATGAGMAIVQPATDLMLTRGIPPSRTGLAIGIKQALGGPGAGLVAGFALPLVGDTLGWRAAYVIGGVGACAVLVVIGRSGGSSVAVAQAQAEGGHPDVSAGPLAVLAVAAGLGTVAQASFVGFAVTAARDAGMSSAVAGTTFAAGCLIGVTTRLVVGSRADRSPQHVVRTTAAMMSVGSIGCGLMATGRAPGILVAMPIVCATAWGWHGLLFFGIARANPSAPARAAGIVGAGVLAGAVLGPLTFGLAAEGGMGPAWGLVGVSGLAAAALMMLGRHLVRRERVTIAPTRPA
jgi:MFS family permease